MTSWSRLASLALILVLGEGPAAAQPGGIPRPPGFDPLGAPEFVPLPAETVPPVKDLTPAHLPPAPPAVARPDGCGPEALYAGWYGYADYLLLRAHRQGLDFALIDRADDLRPRGRLGALSYETRSGFRVGGGYRFASGWDAGFAYTYFRSADRTGFAAPPGGLIYPTLTRPGLVDEVSTASADAGLRYDVYDAEIGRYYDLDDSLTVRVLGGVRFADIGQRLNAFYDGRDANRAAVSQCNELFGVGPLVGGEGRWRLPRGLSLFGNARTGLLYGDLCTAFRETNNGGRSLNAHVTDSYTQIVPVTQIGLGVSWQRGGFRLSAGYEVTHWFNVAERLVPVDDFAEGKFIARPTDLSLEGLFLRVGYAY